MNQEIRYMLALLAAIIDQKQIPVPRRRVNWEHILDAAGSQRVLSIIYLGILGMEKNMSEKCSEEFYRSYKREVLLQEAYKSAEEVILWQLEKNQIASLILRDTSEEELYRIPEMADIQQLEFCVDKKDMVKVHRFMRDMDYESSRDRVGNGIIYTRISGVRIVFYNEVPVENKAFRKRFSDPIVKYLRLDGYQWIHVLTPEEKYLYYVGKLVEWYITGTLRIRSILDFWRYTQKLSDYFSWKSVRSLIEKAKWQEFLHQVELLGKLWFGKEEKEHFGTALELEEYILSLCRENERLDHTLLPHEKIRLDFYRRNRDKEWEEKKLAWMFPPREYMRQFFPVLDRHPSLLFVCWIRRDFRFLKKVVSGGFRRLRLKISIRFSDWKEALVQRIVREDDENSKKINGEELEDPEDMPESEDSEEGESSSERENLSRTS